MNNKAPIILPPAKPYEGTSQHQSVNAAIRRLVDCGVLSDSDWSGVKAHVDSRGTVTVHKMHCTVARLTFTVRSRKWNDDTLRKVTMAVGALREAGWTVINGPYQNIFEVHGPGIEPWAVEERARQKAEAERKASSDAARNEAAVEYRDVLTAAGIPVFVDQPTGTAKLTLAQVRKLVTHFGGTL